MTPSTAISPKPLRVVLATGRGIFHPLHDLEVASVAYVEVCRQAARVAARPPDCLIYDDLNSIVGHIDKNGFVWKGRSTDLAKRLVYPTPDDMAKSYTETIWEAHRNKFDRGADIFSR